MPPGQAGSGPVCPLLYLALRQLRGLCRGYGPFLQHGLRFLLSGRAASTHPPKHNIPDCIARLPGKEDCFKPAAMPAMPGMRPPPPPALLFFGQPWEDMDFLEGLLVRRCLSFFSDSFLFSSCLCSGRLPRQPAPEPVCSRGASMFTVAGSEGIPHIGLKGHQ